MIFRKTVAGLSPLSSFLAAVIRLCAELKRRQQTFYKQFNQWSPVPLANVIDTSPVCANLSKQLGDHNGLKYQLSVLQVINAGI